MYAFTGATGKLVVIVVLGMLELLVLLELLATYQISPWACMHTQVEIIVITSIIKKETKL